MLCGTARSLDMLVRFKKIQGFDRGTNAKFGRVYYGCAYRGAIRAYYDEGGICSWIGFADSVESGF